MQCGIGMVLTSWHLIKIWCCRSVEELTTGGIWCSGRRMLYLAMRFVITTFSLREPMGLFMHVRTSRWSADNQGRLVQMFEQSNCRWYLVMMRRGCLRCSNGSRYVHSWEWWVYCRVDGRVNIGRVVIVVGSGVQFILTWVLIMIIVIMIMISNSYIPTNSQFNSILYYLVSKYQIMHSLHN